MATTTQGIIVGDTAGGDLGGTYPNPTVPGLATKQNLLVSGTNLKTINGSSLLGSGDITITGGSGGSATDATTSAKGIVQLAGDLAGTAAAPTVPALANKKNIIVNQGAKTANFTAAGGNIYLVNASGGNVTVTLPTSTLGQELQIKKTDTSVPTGSTFGIVNVTGTINGTASATVPLRKQGMGKQYVSDGSGGWLVALGDLDITQLGATTTEQGFVVLTGDLGGTNTAPTVPTKVNKVGDTMTGTLTIATGSTGSLQGLVVTGTTTDNTQGNIRAENGYVYARGVFDEYTSTPGIYMGYGPQNDTPRFLLSNGTSSQNWQIDNSGGTLRFIMPGTTKFSVGSTTTDFSSNRATSVADPTGAQDAATKNYVDVLGASKQAVLVTQAVQTANFTAGTGKLYPVNASSAAITVTLPTSTAGQIIAVIKNDSSTNFVNVTGNINGVTNTTINFKLFNEEKTFIPDGSGGWWVSSGNFGLTSLDGRYVLKTGAETIAGIKTFTDTVTLSNGLSSAGDWLLNGNFQYLRGKNIKISGYDGSTGDVYIQPDGGITRIQGGLEMNAKTINSVADPTSAQQAATKAYVDAADATKQGTLTLTTTGTSGAATLSGNTLNIPQYSGGSGGSGITRNISGGAASVTLGSASLVDYVYVCTGTASYTITLPSAASNTNRYTVTNASTATQTLASTAGTINGSTTATLAVGQSVDVIAYSSNWYII